MKEASADQQQQQQQQREGGGGAGGGEVAATLEDVREKGELQRAYYSFLLGIAQQGLAAALLQAPPQVVDAVLTALTRGAAAHVDPTVRRTCLQVRAVLFVACSCTRPYAWLVCRAAHACVLVVSLVGFGSCLLGLGPCTPLAGWRQVWGALIWFGLGRRLGRRRCFHEQAQALRSHPAAHRRVRPSPTAKRARRHPPVGWH